MTVSVTVQRGTNPDTDDTCTFVEKNYGVSGTRAEKLAQASKLARDVVVQLAETFSFTPAELSQEIANQIAS